MPNNKTRIAINGFGRIGRQAFKIALENKNLDVVAINDLTEPNTLAHLLKYDTVYGQYDKKITAQNKANNRTGQAGILTIDRKKFPVYAVPDPLNLPWNKLKVDVVIESTGRFVKDGAAHAHIKAGAKRVIVSAPAKGKGNVQTFVRGVNDENYKSQEVISNASCTTNCVSPVMRVIMDNFGVEKALMTTVHAYTATQSLVDGPNKELRRARAAAQNIVPNTTGAAIATTEALPELKNKFDGIAIRVPVICGSLSDFTVVTKQKVTKSKINQAFKKASKNPIYKGIIRVTDEPIVSSDIIGDTHSAIIDLSFTRVVGGNLVKILAWYDNEWGYSNRLVEMLEQISYE